MCLDDLANLVTDSRKSSIARLNVGTLSRRIWFFSFLDHYGQEVQSHRYCYDSQDKRGMRWPKFGIFGDEN